MLLLFLFSSVKRCLLLTMILLSLSSTSVKSGRTRCTNSCCMTCSPATCNVCYRLNNNPTMCPCIEENQPLLSENTIDNLSNSRFERIKLAKKYQKIFSFVILTTANIIFLRFIRKLTFSLMAILHTHKEEFPFWTSALKCCGILSSLESSKLLYI